MVSAGGFTTDSHGTHTRHTLANHHHAGLFLRTVCASADIQMADCTQRQDVVQVYNGGARYAEHAEQEQT